MHLCFFIILAKNWGIENLLMMNIFGQFAKNTSMLNVKGEGRNRGSSRLGNQTL
jgi:hypothetical protein